MKKIIALLLVIALTAALSVSLTMAYLQDTDDDVNVMTLGNVYIDQIEQQWNADKTELVDFDQGKPLYPYVGTLGWADTPATTAINPALNNAAYRRFTMENVVDKYVSVKNVGDSAAYVRTIFAFEMGGFETIDEFKYKVVGYSSNAENGTEFPGLDWLWGTEFVTQIDGKNYMIREAVHVDPLASGATTIPSLLQVYMNKDCGNAEVEKIDGNGNGTYDILVVSQAVQTEGFENAETALNTSFGTTTGENVAKWFADTKIPVVVSDVDDLREAMKTPGAKIVLSEDVTITDDKGTGFCLYAKYDCEIDLNGCDIVVDMPAKEFYGIFYALNGAKVDIVGDGNITVAGGVGQWVWCTGANGPTEVNIYGGNWTKTSSDFNSEDYCEGIYANREGIINIYGGVFDWSGASKYTLNESQGGIINIYGGTFINFDPRVSHDSDGSYVAEGYTVVTETQSNGDIWYTVIPE